MPWLSPSSPAIPLDKHCWWWASLGGSRLRWNSNFRKNICLRSQEWTRQLQCVHTCSVTLATMYFARHKIQPPRWGPQLVSWTVFYGHRSALSQMCCKYTSDFLILGKRSQPSWKPLFLTERCSLPSDDCGSPPKVSNRSCQWHCLSSASRTW